MPDNNRRKALYDQLTKDGYDLGNYDSFSMNLDNEKNRKNLYDAITADNYDVGDYDSFSTKLNGGTEVDSMGVSSSPISVVDRMTELMREQDNVKKPDKTLRDIVSETPVRTERNLLDKMPISKESAYSVKSEDRNYRTGIPERMKYDTSIRDEDAEVNRQYSPKVEKREEDVFENYRNRFGLTQRGIELQEELAGIQGEIQDKYFKEFEKTPEYAAITGKGYKTQEEADAANNALNDLYIRMYGDIINKEMEPYMKAYEGEMVKRYAPRIQQGLETIAKRNTAEEVGKLVGEVEDLIDKQKNILRSKGPSSGNAMNALMGSRNYIQSTEKERKEMGALEASQRLLEKSQEIIEEAGKKGNTNFFAGLGRGFRDNMDIENFTFGLAEMADAKYLNAALEKAEKGEKLSPAEEKLLEASVVNMATYGYFSSDLGRGYGAGQMTAVSLPFMLEFIANPISGSGNAIAKGLLKYGLKKFGRSSAEKGVLNALGRGITSKAGKFSGRLIGDAAAAAGMEGTTGIGRVASGTLQRLNQNYDYNIGDDGNVHVKKVGDTSMLEALGKSAASTFLENQSEMVFNAFGNFTPLFKGISNVLPGGMNKFMDYVKNSRLGTLYRDMKSNPLLKEMAERTQFRGFGEEYLEEVYNNLMNVPLGEMTMEEVVDLDNNIDIALGLLPTSAFFSMMGLGSMASQRYSSNRRMKKILEDMTPEQQRKMMELTRMSKERGNEDIREFIKITIADNELTPEEKKAEMEYAFELAKQNGIEELREEQDPEGRAADDAYIQGAEMSVEERYAANTELEASEEALSALDPAVTDMIDRLASENASTSEVEEVLSGMDEQTSASARDYYNKLQQIKGIVDSARDDAQEVGDAFEAGLEKAIVTDENGNRTVTTAKLMNLIGEEMAQVMVVSDNGNDAVVMMDDGSKKIVKSKMLKDVQTMPADDVVNAYRENVERQAKERTSFILENHPKTRMPEPGMQIWNGDIPLVIRSVSEDGTVQAFPAVYNDKTGELEIKNGSAPVDMTIRESLALQNDYYNKMDAASKGNNVSEIEAKNASSPEGEENKVSEESDAYILSDKTSDNGEPFYQDGSGNIDLVVIPQEVFDAIGKKAAPFRLIPSMLKHVFDRHGKEMSLENPQDAILFVLDVMDNFDHVRQGDKGALIFSIENGRSRTGKRAVTVLLDSKNGDYYGIKTSGYERIDGLKKRALLWEKGANETSTTGVAPANVTTTNAQQGNGQSGSASNQSNVPSESKDSKSFDEKQEGNVNNLIPVDEKGNPIYHKAPLEATVADLMDGILTDEEVDGFVEANQKEAKEELKKITGKAPKIGTNKAKYISDKNTWQTKVDEAQAKVDYWSQVQNAIKEGRMKPGDRTAEEIRAMGEPVNGNELAAQMLAYGQLPLIREDYMRETGFGENEASGMFGLFRTKDNGGMSIEKAGEKLMLADLESGTGFFDQNDANAGRNALLDVLSSVRTRSGLTDYIKNNREAMAERERLAEQKYEEAQLEAWAQENFGMSYADYVTYEDVIDEIIKEKAIPEDVIQDFYNNFAEELNNINNGRIAEDVALDERRTDSSGSENREGLLSSEQFGDNRGTETDTSTEVDGRVDNESVSAQEEAGAEEIVIPSGTIEAANYGRMNDISERLSEIDSRLIELEDAESSANDFAFAEIVLERNELAQEKVDLEAEYAGLEEMQRESKALRLEEEQELVERADRAIENAQKVMDDIAEEREKVDVNPTDAQKKAGNYKKGHVSVDGYDITIENPKGSERSGTDANGNKWSVTMNNDYGYIRGTEGVDGDHIDVFLSDFPGQGSVYVVDQLDTDTGKFDEHKVMYGFSSMEEATAAYLANYSPGWKGLGTISEVSKEEFKKWIDSSHRKTKPFIEYKSVKVDAAQSESPSTDFKYSSFEEYESDRKERLERSELESAYESILPIVVKYNLIGTPTAKQWKAAQIEAGHKRVYAGRYYLDLFVSELRNGTNPETQSRYDKLKPVKVETAQSGAQTSAKPTETESVPVSQKKDQSGNRLVTDERYAELRERMRKKLGGQMNMGIDPEILAIGTEMAVYHLEKGARNFAEYAKAMIDDLGDVIRPYLKSFYNGARNLPEVENSDIYSDMTPYEEVRTFDVSNFDKPIIDVMSTAETMTREAEIEKEADIAQEKIKKSRSVRKESKKKTVTSQGTSKEVGLFGDLFDEPKKNDYERVSEESAAAARAQREGNSQDGFGRTDKQGVLPTQSGNAGRTVHVEQGRVDGDIQGGRNDGQRNRGISGREGETETLRSRRGLGNDTVTQKKNTRNNHSERGKDYAPISVDARIDANIKAIELARQLLESGEQATPEQMGVLRKFSGWGGLGKAFSKGTSYGPNRIAKKLRELLGEEAYQQAIMSANSAYYTPAYVVDTLWDIAKQLGFKGGNILEGSAGIGNILGQMPTSISERSDIHAVEIDGTSGGILSLLYPDAKVERQGFEDTRVSNGSVDLAITNVPFVTGLRVNDTTGDKDLSKKFHNIHDFCIAKNVRKLREGGLGIFITSNGTLDNSKKLRDWIVNEGGSDFIGAFRMNNKTFGGTGVTSDIIVIRKRVNSKKSANAIDVSTISGERVAEYNGKPLSMDYNRYFIENPDMMAGKMRFAFEEDDTFRPTSKGLYPEKGKDQEKMLSEFAQSFKEEKASKESSDGGGIEETNSLVESGKKIGEVFVKDGKLYINSSGVAQLLAVNDNKVKGHTKVECFESYSAIKKALSDVLEYQANNEDSKELQPLLDKLNKAYDDFVKTYGHFNKNTAIAFLRNDVDYANVASVETYKETGDGKGGVKKSFGKADVMKGRVLERDKELTPSNVKDGIVASMFKHGRIDVPYIAEQLEKTEEEIKKEILEKGYGFEDPTSKQIEVSYQYLSGNVREKLRQAEENNIDGAYDKNIKALQNVIPMDIPAHLIDFTLGSSWVDPKLYDDYVKDRTDIDVKFTPVGGSWFMDAPNYVNKEKNRAMGVRSEMLQRTIMGHELIDAAINNKSITVSTTRKKWDGTTETITDKDATQACAAKIDEIRQDFKEWARQKMQEDSEMSKRMEKEYNERFNNYVPMVVSEEYLPKYFAGASRKFEMRPHQKRAIVRGTMQPLMLAHEVGSGKTFTLISTAMEMRRLGIAHKPMIVVQNATVGQFVASAKELYPNAKILTLEEADRSAEGRKNFYAKIRYNDWDMIVVPQSTFEFIPDSEERQMAFIQDKIEEKMLVLEQMKEADPNGKNIITRQAEKEIANLQEELAGLSKETSKKRTATDEKRRAIALQNANVKATEMLDRRTDDVENFDDMGIDALLVDEAHEYKHLGFSTAMQRGVKGVDPSYSKKSQGVYLKTQAVLEKNNGRNVIFATGTPISNTAAEIWTFMRYLMPADTMREYGIYYFDDFVRNFGNIQQMLEFTTSGKFKENNRFAGYVNLPELVRIWSGVADTVRFEEIEEDRRRQGKPDLRPDMEGGKAQDIYLPQTKALRSIMKFVKKELERFEKMSGKEKKENSHIPLTMYGIAKSAAVDARLVQADAEDDERSKTNEAVRQTLRSLKDTADYKGTVAIFADNYQNKASGFNLYDDIRNKLIKEGVPADEVVVIRPGMTVKKKLEVFEKVNRGEVRVVLGSTYTLGTGVNIQERLHTLIHLDAPNRPMDYTQRNGRILRQGNLHKSMDKPVRVLRFGVEDSLDVTAYQRLKTKGAIADSIMNGKDMMTNSMSNRVLEEEEDVFGDTVAQLSGSEYAMLKNNAEKNVRKYDSRKKQWEADQTYIHHAKPRLEGQIASVERAAQKSREYLQAIEKAFPDGNLGEIKAGKQSFGSVEDMGEFFKEQNKKVLDKMKQMKEGGENSVTRELTVSIGGFDFKIRTELNKEMSSGGGQLFAEIHRKMTYSCEELGLEEVPVKQGLLRNAMEDITENVLTGKDYKERIEVSDRASSNLRSELDQLKLREGKPFEFENELKKAREQFSEYSELMKKELEEKEAKYAEMDKSVETAANVTVDEEEDLLREGLGAYTDRDLSEANDPVAKMLGMSTRTTKKQREFAERERKRMTSHVEKLAKRLNLDNVEIVTDASTLEGKKQRAKGFYSKNTGKITIVIPNNANTFDVEQTLLHEAVAHYGLRELFGEQFDMFLDNVFVNAEPEVRGRIVEIAERNGWDFRKATEEYLAELAENTNFENAHKSGWWQKIKDFFLDMLHRIGFEGFSGVTLTDNELRYVLWRSYENLTEPGRHRSIFGEAADVVKQRELKVGEYAESNVRQNNAAEGKNVAEGREVREPEEDEMFRMVGGIFDHAGNDVEVVERETGNARDMYERTLQTAGYKMREAWQDSMLGLKELQNAIAKATNSRILDYENAYMAENALSSRSLAEMNAYRELVYKPLLEEIAKIKKNGIGYDEVSDYLITKHGIERNREMAVRKALAEDEETAKNNIERWTADKKAVWADDNLTWREKQEKLDEIAESYGANLGVDYSGLSSMFEHEDMADTTKEAYDTVERFEDTVDPSTLWAKVKAATNATLEKQRDSGLMNSDTFDSIQDMYQYYVPLRGWKETTADEVYDYLTSETPVFNAPLKTAKGRTSKADDPIPTIANIAESGILQGNRNLMKQKFLLMAENHRSDLISVNELWVAHDNVNDEWNAVFPIIPKNASSDEVESIVSQFNDRMKELSESNPDEYKKASDAKNIPYKILPNNLREHQVIVKRGGKEYVLTVNGNPRAAQALNGLTNPNATDNPVIKFFEHINRFMAANFTQRNPAFVISNMFRDGFYSNSVVWVKESPVYAAKFNRNWAKSLKEMGGLVRRYKNNSLDMSNDTDRMFFEFINNGGETGYTFIHSVEDYKGIIAKELKKAKRNKLSPAAAFDVLGDAMDTFGRWAEDTSRFAAYRTSREMGRSIAQSVSDAKEISVNFNKKGAGAKTSGKWEKGNRMNALQAWASQTARGLYVFWNAGVQGLTNFARLAKHNPRKFAGMAASYFVLGGMMPVINAALASAMGGDGDEDDYYNLPEYIRRNNICIYVGGEWITIPLPIELRAIYGLGELACGLLSGEENMSTGKATKKVAEQVSQIMPIDIMEGSGGFSAFIPSYIKPITEAYITNKDWTGIPIYRKNDFNKNMPEWTKAYNSTSPELVKLSEMMNEWTGGTKYKSGMIDFNPARVEHLFESYLGGVGTTINQLKKTVMMPFDEDLQEMRNAPVISRFMRSADSRSVQKRINEEYFNNRDRFDLIRQEINGYKKELKNPKIDVMDYAKYQDLYNKMIRSDEYRKYVEFTEMQKTLNKMMEVFKQTGDEELEKQMFVLKEAMNEVAK